MKIQGGFTLVEVIIVLALIVIIGLMASLNFSRWTAKSTVEGYTKEIYSLLMKARNDATNTNLPRSVAVNANQVVISDGTNSTSKNFPRYAITPDANPINFDRRGLTANNRIRITGYPANTNPTMDCIAISATRLNIGLMTGGNCVQR